MQRRIYPWLDVPGLGTSVDRIQAPMVQLVQYGMVLAALLWLPLPFFSPTSGLGRWIGVAAPLLVIVSNLAGVGILRGGKLARGTLVSALGLCSALLLLLLTWGLQTGVMMLLPFSCAIALAGLVAGGRGLVLTALLSVGGVGGIALLERVASHLVGFAPLGGATTILTVGTFALVMGLLSVIVYHGGRILHTTLHREQHHVAELQTHQATLEALVTERTAALQQALAAAQADAALQTRLLTELDQQRTLVRDLSVPVIPVSATTLVMPLVGHLDAARLSDLQEQALHALQQSHARRLILDITGVPQIDDQSAQAVLQVIAAARLLGSQVAIVGVRPDVAQTLTSLSIQLGTFQTYRDLAAAISAHG